MAGPLDDPAMKKATCLAALINGEVKVTRHVLSLGT